MIDKFSEGTQLFTVFELLIITITPEKNYLFCNTEKSRIKFMNN